MNKYFFFTLRPKHWAKNLLVFIPLLFGKKAFTFPDNFQVLLGFFIFCLASSAAYLANDLMDIKRDKAHPLKSLRPIAAGKVSKLTAKAAITALIAISVITAFMLNNSFGLLIIVYLFFNVIYSRVLKEVVIIDVFCLAGFFLLRVVAGTIIAKVDFSYWMIFMTVFLALFLGFNKRRRELKILKKDAVDHRGVLVEYSPYFIDQMISIITSSIVIVYMLYAVDARTVHYFGTNHLYYSVPFVYYGIFRYLYLVHKKYSGGDPVNVLFKDKMMQFDILLWVFVCIGVIYFGI
jgi:4-hydroxybenzoate polyprenyltransferase